MGKLPATVSDLKCCVFRFVSVWRDAVRTAAGKVFKPDDVEMGLVGARAGLPSLAASPASLPRPVKAVINSATNPPGLSASSVTEKIPPLKTCVEARGSPTSSASAYRCVLTAVRFPPVFFAPASFNTSPG